MKKKYFNKKEMEKYYQLSSRLVDIVFQYSDVNLRFILKSFCFPYVNRHEFNLDITIRGIKKKRFTFSIVTADKCSQGIDPLGTDNKINSFCVQNIMKFSQYVRRLSIKTSCFNYIAIKKLLVKTSSFNNISIKKLLVKTLVSQKIRVVQKILKYLSKILWLVTLICIPRFMKLYKYIWNYDNSRF